MGIRALCRILQADFARNTGGMDRATVTVFRLGQWAAGRPLPLRVAWALLDLVWTRVLIGAEIPRQVECGSGLRLPHAGRGVIIHADTKIGDDVWIYHRVTIGVRGDGPPPVLGDRVYVGTGACILGPVKIGDGARIGAGAVVTKDVPAGCTARGVPAVVCPPRRPAPADDHRVAPLGAPSTTTASCDL